MEWFISTCRLGVRAWRRPWTVLALALMAAPTLGANAIPVVDGSVLGVSAHELQGIYANLQRAGKPVAGPRGLRGQWLLHDTLVAGLPFETTFFMKNGQVKRIEQMWVSQATACREKTTFQKLVADLSSRFGPVQTTGSFPVSPDAAQESAAWVDQQADVTLHYVMSPSQCSARLVYQEQVLKDASEL